jgi:Zn-dependent protease/CBS domain-containing protein
MNRAHHQTHRGIRIARIFGVDIELDPSLFLIIGLIALSLASGPLPHWHPEWGQAFTWAMAILAALLFLSSLLLHELSHAVVAKAHGIRVRRITLFLFGGAAQIEDSPSSPRVEFLMAVVGPLTSLVLGIASFAIAFGLEPELLDIDRRDPAQVMAAVGPVATLLLWLGPINFALALFNLVPGFPLDGGRIFRSLLWWITGDLRRATRWASAGGRAFAWLLMAAGVVLLLGGRVPVFGGGLFQGIWLILIGWFLYGAAVRSYEQLLLEQSLAGVHVADVMTTRVTTIHPELTVHELVRDFITQSDQRSFPVLSDGQLVGLVTFDAVREVPSAAWTATRVAEIMLDPSEMHSVSPAADITAVLRQFSNDDADELPVVTDGGLVGWIRRKDIMTWLTLRTPELSTAP